MIILQPVRTDFLYCVRCVYYTRVLWVYYTKHQFLFRALYIMHWKIGKVAVMKRGIWTYMLINFRLIFPRPIFQSAVCASNKIKRKCGNVTCHLLIYFRSMWLHIHTDIGIDVVTCLCACHHKYLTWHVRKALQCKYDECRSV